VKIEVTHHTYSSPFDGRRLHHRGDCTLQNCEVRQYLDQRPALDCEDRAFWRTASEDERARARELNRLWYEGKQQAEQLRTTINARMSGPIDRRD